MSTLRCDEPGASIGVGRVRDPGGCVSDWDAADLAERRKRLGVKPLIDDAVRRALDRAAEALGAEVGRAEKPIVAMGLGATSAFLAADLAIIKHPGVGKKTAHLIRAAQQVMRGTAPAKAATKSAEKRCPHCGHKVRDR